MSLDLSSDDPSCYKLITLPNEPYISVTFQDGKPVFGGAMLPVINEIFAHYNFCYNLTFAGDIGFGQYVEANNSFTGMLGQIKLGNYDFILNPMAFTASRYGIFNYGVILSTLLMGIVYKYPRAEPDLRGFIKPFNFQSWTLIFLSLLLVFIVLSWVSILQRRVLHGKKERSSFDKIGIVFMDALGIPLMQNQRLRFKLFAGYMAIAIWMMTGLIIGIIYKSNLMAFLIIPKVETPFSNLEELVAQTTYGWITPRGSMFVESIKNSPKGSTYRKLYDGLAGMYASSRESLYAIDHKKQAVVTAETQARDYLRIGFSENGYCTRTMTPHLFYPIIVGMLYRDNLTIAPMMNRVLTYYKEFGLLEYHIRKESQNATNCIGKLGKSKDNDLVPLAIGDFYGVFLLLAGGYIIGVFALIAELIVHSIGSKSLDENK